MENSRENIKRIGIGFAAVVGGFAVKKLLESGYKRVYKKAPPNKVSDEEISWVSILGWTVFSGMIVSATKMMIKREGAKKL